MTPEMLREALADLPPLSDGAYRGFLAHWRLLLARNTRSNLTAIVDPQEAVWRHYRDALAVWPHLRGDDVVDFGSGAGFPGLVLALADPRLRVTLVEPRRKRASFLTAAAAKLGLGRVTICERRVEGPPPATFDHAVTRATFSGPTFVPAARAWLRPGGSLWCFRGADTEAWGRRHTYTLMGPPPLRLTRHLDEVAADVGG